MKLILVIIKPFKYSLVTSCKVGLLVDMIILASFSSAKKFSSTFPSKKTAFEIAVERN